MDIKRLLSLLSLVVLCEARNHTLKIENDSRGFIPLTTFGYYSHGFLQVNLTHFTYRPPDEIPLCGFTIKKILSGAIDPRDVETYGDKCLLNDESNMIRKDENVIFFVMDFHNELLRVNCSAHSDVSRLQLFNNRSSVPVTTLSDLNMVGHSFKFEAAETSSLNKTSCAGNITFPLNKKAESYSSQFVMYVPSENEQGLYASVFHSCENYRSDPSVLSSFSIQIIERNVDNYLSAGEMPLPEMYTMLSTMFFMSSVFWIYYLVKSRHPVYKIHYLMGLLVVLKSVGLLLHGINYYYIEVTGEHETTWAVMYYVIHLLRGSLLFMTIILIGTGWTFIKHILSPKDKKIFMIVIPLQVIANVAEIILDESEEGDVERKRWLEVFTFVDLICCFAILFPIVWSIKHLQDASQTDGKAAINLRKLQLFRHFYIMIVCYIYVTRIIVYLLRMTVPFQYEWLDEMFKEMATFVFFVMTGYKFRPASENPYFNVLENDEPDMDIYISKCGFTEGLSKLSRISNDFGDDDKDSLLIFKRESSYDYD